MAESRKSGLAIGALVLGCLALFFAMLGLLGLLISLPGGIAAIIMGAIAIVKTRAPGGQRGRGMAVSGLVLGILAPLLALIMVVGQLASIGHGFSGANPTLSEVTVAPCTGLHIYENCIIVSTRMHNPDSSNAQSCCWKAKDSQGGVHDGYKESGPDEVSPGATATFTIRFAWDGAAAQLAELQYSFIGASASAPIPAYGSTGGSSNGTPSTPSPTSAAPVTKAGCNKYGACMKVVSAQYQAGCGYGSSTYNCHVLSVKLDNANGTQTFSTFCCWKAYDGNGAGYTASSSGADSIAAGGKADLKVSVSVEGSSGNMVTLWYDENSFSDDGMSSRILAYSAAAPPSASHASTKANCNADGACITVTSGYVDDYGYTYLVVHFDNSASTKTADSLNFAWDAYDPGGNSYSAHKSASNGGPDSIAAGNQADLTIWVGQAPAIAKLGYHQDSYYSDGMVATVPAY